MTRLLQIFAFTAFAVTLAGCEDNSRPQYTNADGEAASAAEIAAVKAQAEQDARDQTTLGMREKVLENERKKLIIQKSAGAVLTAEQEAIIAAGPTRLETENERRARQRAYDNRQRTSAREAVTEGPQNPQ